jgi:predicted nuclease of predicted toxin-antitoxin system
VAEAIRFHLDENVNPAIALGLRQRGVDVTTSQGVGLLGVPDLEQLAYARREGRVIFTEDADFLIIAARTSEHHGIAYARKGTRSIGQIVQWLELMQGVMTAEEMRGHVEYL